MYHFLGVKDKTLGSLIVSVLMMMFVASLVTIFVREPMTWLDEQTHYGRAIELSNGDLFVSQNGDYSQMGGYISKSQKAFADRTIENRGLTNGIRNSTVSVDWINHYGDLRYTSEQVFYANTNTVPYTPISYIPYLFVSGINKIFRVNVVMEYVLMRIAGFLFSFMLLMMAIKIIPFGKLTLAILGASPTVIASVTAVTADGFNIVISILFIASVVKLFYKLAKDKKVTNKSILLFIGLMLIISLSKIPTFFLLGLVLPMLYMGIKEKSLAKIQIFGLVSGLVISAICVLGWVYLVRHVNTGAFWGRNVSTGSQVLYILSDIPKFIGLLSETILRYDFLNMQLGYTNTPAFLSIPQFISFIYTLALFGSVFVKDTDFSNYEIYTWYTTSFNIAKYSIFALISIAIFGVLYLQFSEIGSGSIDGVQPRYFIPFHALLFTQMSGMKSVSKMSSYWIVGVVHMTLLVYLGMLFMQLG